MKMGSIYVVSRCKLGMYQENRDIEVPFLQGQRQMFTEQERFLEP